jgi:hypothetical protein
MTEPDPVPEMRELVGGRFAAMCRVCMLPSAPTLAPTAAEAWADLQRHGWRWIEARADTPAGPRCPQCAGQTAAEAATSAQRRRKRTR